MTRGVPGRMRSQPREGPSGSELFTKGLHRWVEYGQACGLPPFDVRENQPVVLGKAEPAKPAEPEEPEGWTDPDTDPDLPF